VRKPAGLGAFTNTTTASDCQTPSVWQIPGDKSEQEVDGYGGKEFEKRGHKTTVKNATGNVNK